MGDFNKIVSNDKKFGGRTWQEHLMANFRAALEDGNLYDMGWR